MIKQIKKIKNLGVFSNYQAKSSLLDFRKFNFIYGWNGSGKTTLSRLFAALTNGSLDKFPSLEYEITCESGIYKNGQPYNKKLRVFNSDYVFNNVQLLTGKTQPIYILGEENKKLAEEIDADEKILSEKNDKLKKLTDDREKTEKSKNKYFTDIARIISSNTSGEATRKYDKRDAEQAFERLTGKQLQSEEAINALELTLRQIEKPTLSEIDLSPIKHGEKEITLNAISFQVIETSKNILQQTIDSIVIDRLKENNDISEWVEKGISLHEKHSSKSCEFCNQILPAARITALRNHFNEADMNLKNSIDEQLRTIETIQNAINGLTPLDKANLYEELQSSYLESVGFFNLAQSKVIENLSSLEKSLRNKKLKTSESLDLTSEIDLNELETSINNLNKILKKHNDKTANFAASKTNARNLLEVHYLSTIHEEVLALNQALTAIKNEIDTLTFDRALEKLQEKINQNRAVVSSAHKACDEINKKLETFLGIKEIRLEVGEEGYLIKRNGILAENLSEGEKTAIAFIYFTVHLRDQNFDVKEGIVIVDDPISSLDSNSIYQAFSLLKNAVQDAKQVFIFTHNFDFLRLILSWMRHGVPQKQQCYYMVKNSFENGQRSAYLDAMDKALLEHESEYHYLFKLLFTFQSNGSIEQAYPMPNIARKVLESFLMFRVPNSGSMYKKLEQLKPHFNEDKLIAINKFVNDQSHITGKGFDPALVPETKKNVGYLLELIKTVFPEHYQILEASITTQEPVAAIS